MDRNNFLLFNNIVYRMYEAENFSGMKLSFLADLRMLIPNTCASILTTRNPGAPNSFFDPVSYPEEYSGIEKAYLEIGEQSWIRWARFSERPLLFRETDMLSEEDRIKTPVYQKCYKPYGIHYALQQFLMHEGYHLGTVSIYRKKASGDFSDTDMFYLQALSSHLSAVFYRNLAERPECPPELPKNTRLIKEYRLTDREAEILFLLWKKQDNDEISSKLFISEHTLKKHLQNIYRKFNVSSRWELMKLTGA